MKDSNNRFSRADLQKKKKTDRYLNILIGVVVIAIIVSAAIIFSPKDSAEKPEEDTPNTEHSTENKQDEPTSAPEENEDADNEGEELDDGQENNNVDHDADEVEDEIAMDREVIEDVEDPVVDQTIIDHNWQPIGTTQQGEHVSVYDKSSVDWQEKIRAIEYATGLVEENMIIWRLQNGGSPQKSIGIVSTKNQEEKYRVYLEWVDGEGWKPEKMDILNTVEFN